MYIVEILLLTKCRHDESLDLLKKDRGITLQDFLWTLHRVVLSRRYNMWDETLSTILQGSSRSLSFVLAD